MVQAEEAQVGAGLDDRTTPLNALLCCRRMGTTQSACNKVAGSSSSALGKALMRLDWENLTSPLGRI